MDILLAIPAYWYTIVICSAAGLIAFNGLLPVTIRFHVLIGSLITMLLVTYLYATRNVELEYKVKELEDQVKEQKLAVESQNQNVQVVTKYLTKIKVIHDVQNSNTVFIKEHAQAMDSQCKLSVEVIDAHNQAAVTPPVEESK